MNRRFAVEEVDNGWLLKISEAGSDKLLGRYVFLDLQSLIAGLKVKLEEKK